MARFSSTKTSLNSAVDTPAVTIYAVGQVS